MVRYASFLVLSAALLAPAPAPAFSQRVLCGPRDAFIKEITGKYKERRQAIATTLNQLGLYEVWVSDKGTFTVTLTRAQSDVTCIVLAGRNWSSLPPKTPEKDT